MPATFISSMVHPSCRLAWCLALFASVLCARAQQTTDKSKPEIPSGNLLACVPENSQWVVTFFYPQDRSKDAALPALEKTLPRKIITTRTCELIHEETCDVSGEKSDKWQVGTTFYLKPPGQKFWGEYDPAWFHNNLPTSPALSPIPLKGFQDLDWISRETFAGSIKQNDKEWFVFIPLNAREVDVAKPADLNAQPVIAYVDASTRLPVRYKNRDVVRSYSFAPESPPRLVLPADLAQEIRDGKERRAKVFAVPKREY